MKAFILTLSILGFAPDLFAEVFDCTQSITTRDNSENHNSGKVLVQKKIRIDSTVRSLGSMAISRIQLPAYQGPEGTLLFKFTPVYNANSGEIEMLFRENAGSNKELTRTVFAVNRQSRLFLFLEAPLVGNFFASIVCNSL